MPQGIKFDRKTRVGACADYLIGRSWKEIEHKWGVSSSMVCQWIRKVGCFKLRVNDPGWEKPLIHMREQVDPASHSEKIDPCPSRKTT